MTPAKTATIAGAIPVPSGREYAILGTTGGTSFIEVTNPGNPQIVDYVNGPNSLWRDVKVFGSYCYAVSEGGDGIQIISMANIDNGSVTLSKHRYERWHNRDAQRRA